MDIVSAGVSHQLGAEEAVEILIKFGKSVKKTAWMEPKLQNLNNFIDYLEVEMKHPNLITGNPDDKPEVVEEQQPLGEFQEEQEAKEEGNEEAEEKNESSHSDKDLDLVSSEN